MAYSTQSSGESNTILWVAGGAVLFYLWYVGYFTSATTTAADGTVDENGVPEPTTSVASGATTQSVNQVAGTTSITQATDPTSLANESYYTWLASGQPLSVLEDMNAAATLEESNYIAANGGTTVPATSVASASPTSTLTPTVGVPATQAVINAVGGSDYATAGPVALGLATLANGILTYTSGISYQVNSDGSLTMLTPSTAVQAANAAKATPTTQTATTQTPSSSAVVPVASTSMVARTPAVAAPLSASTGRISTPTPSRQTPTSVSSGNANPSTSVNSSNPGRGKL